MSAQTPILPISASHGRKASTATVSNLSNSMNQAHVVCEGWLLKKRRKKMQGFARRYFTLYQSGLLVYAFGPGQPVRDHVHLHSAAISTAPGRKDIHLDSNTATFHVKCLSSEDFSRWMAVFRKFILNGQEARRAVTARHPSRQASVSLNRSGAFVDEIGVTISEIEKAFAKLSQDCIQLTTPSTVKKVEKRESKFGLFKRHGDRASPSEISLVDSGSSPPSSCSPLDTLTQFQSLIEILKSQHTALSKAIQSSLVFDTLQQSPSALPTTAEEEEDAESKLSHSPRKPSFRNSTATTISDSVEWFDATDDGFDGLQEFVLEGGADAHETERELSHNDSWSSLDTQDDSSIDTDVDDSNVISPLTSDQVQQPLTPLVIERRTQLPSPPPADEGSLFAILKKNVGKDLSTLTFPVTFNEPLTLLQRAAEEVEYFGLLDEAAKAQDPFTRISYVAAFAVSSYAHTRYRSGRKGFNPMLGETFEDARMKFIAEKVRHNPLEIAYHAEGENWEVQATTNGRTKFWGKSLEIIPLGTTRVRIGSDTYVWKKPSSFIRNLMVGTKYFEHCGQMTIENSVTSDRCVLEFKQNGYWGPTNLVSGSVYDSDNEVLGRLEGKWDDQICQVLKESHLHVLWKIAPFPKNQHEYYGFTAYGITLNETTSDLVGKLPSTDSRYRPDVRALENGLLEEAESEKARIELLQRERRNRGQDCQPRWFKQVGDEWEYAGGYWEKRAQGWNGESITSLW